MFRIIMHSMVVSAALALSAAPLRAHPTPKQSLGRNLFFDSTLSVPTGQSCSDCHQPSAGFADPDTTLPVSSGAVAGRTGMRNAPTAAYAAYSPPFHFDTESGLYIGGQFWDGRAATLADQAKRPFLNPVEMNNANAAQVVDGVRNSPYADQFRAVYGATSLDNADSHTTWWPMPSQPTRVPPRSVPSPRSTTTTSRARRP